MSKKSQRNKKLFKHNHQRKLLAFINQGKLPTAAGSVSSINIFHDDWCQLIQGRGPCDCNPDIRIAWTQHPGANN